MPEHGLFFCNSLSLHQCRQWLHLFTARVSVNSAKQQSRLAHFLKWQLSRTCSLVAIAWLFRWYWKDWDVDGKCMWVHSTLVCWMKAGCLYTKCVENLDLVERCSHNESGLAPPTMILSPPMTHGGSFLCTDHADPAVCLLLDLAQPCVLRYLQTVHVQVNPVWYLWVL